MSISDQDLVDRCRDGDRDAFAVIVQRYQNLICSIAYSSTGSLNLSEELAQDTFVAAWKSICELREPRLLRQWLCGIARNRIRNSVRQQKRDVLHGAARIDRDEVAVQSEADPVDETIAQEEAAMMQRSLQTISETYRVPLILFYREQQSVANVAQLMGISEDAVKQRLARGRKQLRSEIASVVERGLRQTAPGRAFTIGVLTALPVMSGTAKAATLTATGAKGVSAMNVAGWTGILGAILGPIIGLAGAWFGVKMSLRAAQSERERRFIIRSTCWIAALVLAFGCGLTALLMLGRRFAREDPTAFTFAVIGLTVGYTVCLLATIIVYNRRHARIRREVGTTDLPPSVVAERMPAPLKNWQYPAVYQSRLRLFGLPLLSIRFNGVVAVGRREAAVGWIAIGDKAYGILFACGPIAVGGIACGAIGLGGITFAGLAFGLVPMGGAAVGWLAMGGVAIGILAFGGCALAWQAAMGGVSAAREFAIGGLVVARHANDEIAKEFMENHPFFQISDTLATHGWIWIVLVAITLLPMVWAQRKVQRENQ